MPPPEVRQSLSADPEAPAPPWFGDRHSTTYPPEVIPPLLDYAVFWEHEIL